MFTSFVSCPVAANSYTITGFICQLTNLVLTAIPILVALALLFFFWGLAGWVMSAGDAEKAKEGRARMIWGLIALFFIVSVGGVVGVLARTFFPGGYSTYGSGYGATSGGSSSGVYVDISNERQLGLFRKLWCQMGFSGPIQNCQ